MEDAMVTGRMPVERKAAGNAVLERAGLNASQAVNIVYERLVEEQSADFLQRREISPQEWRAAAEFVDSIAAPFPIDSRFDSMSSGEIAYERAKSRGWI